MSPYAYLAAERVDRVLPRPASWQPVLLGGLFKLTGRSSWALGDYERRRRGMAEIERRAELYGAPPLIGVDRAAVAALRGAAAALAGPVAVEQPACDARRDVRASGGPRARVR